MNSDTNLIHIGLYATGSAKNHCRAEYVKCDNCQNCSLYNKGMCLRVTSIFKPTNCPYGHIDKVDGYTTRSAKYLPFVAEVRQNEKYHQMSAVEKDIVIAKVGEYIYLNLAYVDIMHNQENTSFYKAHKNEYYLDDPLLFAVSNDFIPLEKFGIELIHEIVEYKAYAIFNHTYIPQYKEIIVPKFLKQLRKEFPGLYENFINSFPQYKVEDVIGKKAYINTLKQYTKLTDNKDNIIYELQGNRLVATIDSGFDSPFGCIKKANIQLFLDGTETIIVADENWCDEKTKFVEENDEGK